jgi:hypothetical protein
VLLGAADFFAVVTAGVLSGVIAGVLAPERTAYGSAVLGLGISGRRTGRRTVPLIRDPVPVELFKADFVESPDMAEGGLVEPAVAVEVVLEPEVSDLDETDRDGE